MLKPATVYVKMTRVSAFYHWLMTDPRLSGLVGTNPAAQARPRYPRPCQSESTKALTDEEMNQLGRPASAPCPGSSGVTRSARRLRTQKLAVERVGVVGPVAGAS